MSLVMSRLGKDINIYTQTLMFSSSFGVWINVFFNVLEKMTFGF
jgi:hypothetical protein